MLGIYEKTPSANSVPSPPDVCNGERLAVWITPRIKRVRRGLQDCSRRIDIVEADEGASFSTVRGWTIVTDRVHLTIWSFAPKTDPAYPSVVKRMMTTSGTSSVMTMKVKCELDKVSCDNLVRQFYDMNFRGSGAQLERK